MHHLAAATLILCAMATQARAAADPMVLLRSMQCGSLREMLRPTLDLGFSERFVTENARLIPPDAWTPAMLQVLNDRVRRCVADSPQEMAPFREGSMLGNYLRAAAMSVEAWNKKLEKEQEARRFDALERQSRHDIASGAVEADLRAAERASDSADIQGALAKARRDLLNDALTDADRESFADRLKDAESKLSAAIAIKRAESDAQEDAQRTEVQKEDQELEQIQKLNDAKKAQITADQQRRAKLDAARREAAQLDAQQRQMAHAVPAPAPPTPVPADDCPAMKAHEADVAPLVARMKADADKLEGKTPAELALAPELACNALDDQVALFRAMLGYAQECPATSKVGGVGFRNNVAGMVLQLQSQGRQMGCR